MENTMKDKKTGKRVRSIRTADPVQHLRKRWNSLTPLQRGERLRTLVKQGWSRRALAKKLGCAESTIRQCLGLTELAKAEKQALRCGRLGRKKALERVRMQREGEHLQQSTPTIEEKENFIEQCGVLLAQFVRHRIADAAREQFFLEVLARLNWIWLSESRQSRTGQTGICLPKDPGRSLKRSQPKESEPNELPARISYYADWIALWLGRLVPLAETRDSVLGHARQRLGAG
jgi:transposase